MPANPPLPSCCLTNSRVISFPPAGSMKLSRDLLTEWPHPVLMIDTTIMPLDQVATQLLDHFALTPLATVAMPAPQRTATLCWALHCTRHDRRPISPRDPLSRSCALGRSLLAERLPVGCRRRRAFPLAEHQSTHHLRPTSGGSAVADL